jgi:hypothetical protein
MTAGEQARRGVLCQQEVRSHQVLEPAAVQVHTLAKLTLLSCLCQGQRSLVWQSQAWAGLGKVYAVNMRGS